MTSEDTMNIPEDVMKLASKLVNFTISNYESNHSANISRDAIAIAILTDREARSGSIPAGYKLVPVEPTPEMIMTQGKSRPDLAKNEKQRETAEKLLSLVRRQAVETWKEMLAASPSPSREETEGEKAEPPIISVGAKLIEAAERLANAADDMAREANMGMCDEAITQVREAIAAYREKGGAA